MSLYYRIEIFKKNREMNLWQIGEVNQKQENK